MASEAFWQFPPRNGGIKFIQDPSSAYFSDDPLPKLVREVVQNSLDAKESGLNTPVEVVFTETYVEADDIGGADLKCHLKACQDQAKEEKRPNVLKHYTRALKTLNVKKIRCLQIVDSGTTGLEGKNWDALVIEEGSVQKSGDAPGGSYGIGKNAVFNVSDIRTVIYSTRCLERQGRMEKLQGKATLMAHPNPKDKGEQLQHIGFFARSGVKPILGKDIPDLFRLDDIGAGVFIMGFNPRSEEWAREVVSAVIENFFYAIHYKRLVVKVKSQKPEEIVVNHETLDLLFEGKDNNPSYHYYRAIRDEEQRETDTIGNIGPLAAHVLVGEGPRRTAYVNLNGMLITDIRDQKINPIAPRGRELWPNFAVVIVPGTIAVDEWIRRTENPSHDSMSPAQLIERRDIQEAHKWFREARYAIRAIVDKKAEIEKYGDPSNLDELASMFPDEFDPDAPGNRVLKTTISKTRITTAPPGSGVDSGAGTESGTGSGTGTGTGTGNDNGGGTDIGNGNGGGTGTRPGSGPGSSRGARPLRPPRLNRPRFIPTDTSKATIAFTLTEEVSESVNIALRPAGGEWAREDKVAITEAVVLSPKGQEVRIEDGVLSLIPNANERVVIEVTTSDDIRDLAFKIG